MSSVFLTALICVFIYIAINNRENETTHSGFIFRKVPASTLADITVDDQIG